MERLGEVLLSIGALGVGTLNRALALQRSTGGRLGTILLEQGLVTEETLARALSKVTGRPYAHWDRIRDAARDTTALLPMKVAIRVLAVPFEREGRVLRVAMRDPNDLAAEDEIALVTGKKVEPWCTAEFRLAEALERFYGERRSARFRVLAERLERGIRPTTPPPPPPPPPELRGDPYRPEAEAKAIPIAARGRPSDVWALDGGSNADDIEIATWRPSPFARPAPPTAAAEIEFVPDEEPPAVTAPAPSPSAVPPPRVSAAASAPHATPTAASASAETPVRPAEAPVPMEAPAEASHVPPGEALPAAPEPEPTPTPVEPPASGRAPRPASLEEARERIRAAEARDDIADAALDYIEPDFPLTALLIARKDDVIGWQVRSRDASRSAFKAVRIPFKQPSIFLNVKLSGTPYQGLLPDLPSHAALISSLGRAPGRCAVLPVILKKRVVAFLFLELTDKTLAPDRLDEMKALATAIAEGLAALILQHRGRDTA